MNITEFNEKFGHLTQKTKIHFKCNCGKPRCVIKEKIIVNILKNETYKCRSCAMIENHKTNPRNSETKEKQRQGRLGKKHSDKSKQQMIESANAKWKTEWGKKQKKILAKKTSLQHCRTNFDKSKRKVLYISAKNNNQIRVCNSSAEFIACEDFLEKNPLVLSYETQVSYEINNRSRSLDFMVHYIDGTTKVIEVKPHKRMTEPDNIFQIQDSSEFATQNGFAFELWTEKELKITKWKEARDRADKYIKDHYDVDYSAHRAEKGQEKAKRHYDKVISKDKVEVYCEYCKTTHEALRLTHDKNIARNGRYICEREGGFIAGSKPKKKKVNPYAEQGMKLCNECARILPFECFGTDKNKFDGYATRCKECRTKFYKDKYKQK